MNESVLAILSAIETIIIVALIILFTGYNAPLAIGGNIGLILIVLIIFFIVNAISLARYLGIL